MSDAIDGILLLNKPAGLTSNRALQQIKRALRARKAGHTGSLDPAATGMLPLCFGEATKVSAYLLDADKTYRVTARLGQATDTGDADGSITDEQSVPEWPAGAWATLLQTFIGDSLQVPPMYSALKKDGKRLYELARKGEVVERKARAIRVYAIELLELAGTRLVFRARCSKGTYIRSLVEDIAAKVGTVAHTAHLHRESVGGFDAAKMLDMSLAKALAREDPAALRRCVLPADTALASMPQVDLEASAAGRFRQGQVVPVTAGDAPGLVRVYGPGESERFIGVGELDECGRVAPKRVFAQP